MPELPEVETVRRGLKERAVGRRVAAVEVGHAQVIHGSPDEFRAAIEGCRIEGVDRKGKALVLRLASEIGGAPHCLLVRLGMTGRVVVVPRQTPLEPHTHVRLVLDDGAFEVRYRDARRFGRLRSCAPDELDAVLARLGPDAPQITLEQFLAALARRRGAIKTWLMNQQLLSGVGNIYADEALHRARIHPETVAGRLSPQAARRLLGALKQVLARAVELQGTSFRDYVDIEGRPGNFLPRLRVYQRTGEACRCCHTPIRRIVIAGRSTHFCPRCQPRPRHAAPMRGPRKLAK